jgi:hypothetical protein
MSIGGSRKWLTFLVCGQIATAGLVFGGSDEFGRRVSAGIKIGVPLTQVAETGIPGNEMQTKRYTFGPVVNVNLIRGVSVELSAIYKRIDQQATATTVLGYVVLSDEDSYVIEENHRVSTVGRSWEFPIAAQYHFSLGSIRPYVESGLSFNHLADIFSYPPFIPQATVGTTFEPTQHNTINRKGFLVGAGTEITHHFIHLSPGIRLTRYPTILYDSTVPPIPTNSVDFLLGLRF